jgi:hypothetical protein
MYKKQSESIIVLLFVAFLIIGCEAEQDCMLDCGAHGTCTVSGSDGLCVCDEGWAGDACGECAPGYISYMDTCIPDPCTPEKCNGNGVCDNSSGLAECMCTGNFTGATCNECAGNFTGPNCDECVDNFTGPDCNECAVDISPVLFIGNSYTASNSLPAIVAGFADETGCPIDFEATTPGGYRFSDHAYNAGTQTLISSREWSAIVLQNQSQVPGWRPEDVISGSLPHALRLADKAREGESDPQLVYFMTWGRRDGDSANCNYYPLVCTFEGHTEALHDGYTIYAENTAGELSPVGLAWAAVRSDAEAPFHYDQLWSNDGSHPSLLGSYLAAAVLYYTLSGQSPVGMNYTGGLSSENAAYLQQMAANTVEENGAVSILVTPPLIMSNLK